MSNPLISIEDPGQNRRHWIQMTAAALLSGVGMELEGAQHVHEQAGSEKKKGAYVPKEFAAGEWALLRKLTELIIPADEVSGSALDAGAPEFIDLLAKQNEKLADIYHGGLAWMDAESRRRWNTTFVGASAAQHKELLDALVATDRRMAARKAEELVYERAAPQREHSNYTQQSGSDLEGGARFFDWVRRMTVDAFYTSPIGIKDIGFIGNRAYTKYETPKDSIEYAMNRSPFRKQA
jgi:gluconate 2-dehydrogenase gamma chain